MPGALWDQVVRWVRNSGERRVTVKDSQKDSATRVEKFWGRPKRGESWERESQRGQEPSFEGVAWGGGAGGGVVLVPRVEHEVMEPRVMRTMSVSWTWITPVKPDSSM